MDITPLIPQGTKIISGYGQEGIAINGEHCKGSLLVLPEKVLLWPALCFDDNAFSSLKILLEQEDTIEILLIGCGERQQTLPLAIRQWFRQKAIAVDSMNTGAACRTYNVLMTEGRRVGAALLV